MRVFVSSLWERLKVCERWTRREKPVLGWEGRRTWNWLLSPSVHFVFPLTIPFNSVVAFHTQKCFIGHKIEFLYLVLYAIMRFLLISIQYSLMAKILFTVFTFIDFYLQKWLFQYRNKLTCIILLHAYLEYFINIYVT